MSVPYVTGLHLRNFILIFFLLLLAACASRTNPDVSPTPAREELAVPWGSQGLTGRLMVILYNAKGNTLVQLDLTSGATSTIFQAPENGWLAEAAVSPDGEQIVLAYSPPPDDEKPQFGNTDLFLMPLEGSGQPEPFLVRKDPQESFYHPAWTPDGQSIYFTHYYTENPDDQYPLYRYAVERADFNGAVELIILDGLWPSLAPDGSRLAYLSANQLTTSNYLFLANPDGTGNGPVLEPGAAQPVDAHLFTKDSKALIFSRVNLQPAPANSWLEQLFGVDVALAHNEPSDWYLVPVEGAQPQRLTNLGEMRLAGSLSPDGERMAFISANGLYVMNIDGSGLIKLSHDVMVGSVDWIP